MQRACYGLIALLGVTVACTGGTPPGQPTPTPVIPRVAQAEAVPRLTPVPGVPGDPNLGRELLATKGCAGCHTISGVSGANGVAGPNLTNVTLRPTIAGDQIPSSPDMLRRWLLDPPAVKPGTTMPNVGLTSDEARDLVAFLEAQPHTSQP
jgi:cytochrome c2